jgi:hypothetical protein
MVGMGHWPLIPITGRVSSPSGLADTQVMLKSYVTVSAVAWIPQPRKASPRADERSMRVADDSGEEEPTTVFQVMVQ